jgi:hypothetical protein
VLRELFAQLEQAIDPDCTFSADTVEQFTQDVVENHGDYTIFFWIRKPDASQSQAEFVPGFSWYSSLSPPQHPVFQLAVRSGQGRQYLMQGQTFTCNGEHNTAGINMVEVSDFHSLSLCQQMKSKPLVDEP